MVKKIDTTREAYGSWTTEKNETGLRAEKGRGGIGGTESTLKKAVENRKEGLKCSSVGDMACAQSSLKNKSQRDQNPHTSVKVAVIIMYFHTYRSQIKNKIVCSIIISEDSCFYFLYPLTKN